MHDLTLHHKINPDLVLDALFDGEHLLLQFADVAAQIELHVITIRHTEGQLLDDHLARIVGLCKLPNRMEIGMLDAVGQTNDFCWSHIPTTMVSV